jgi:dephospho-CoA kinase
LPFDFVVTVEAPISDQIARMVEYRGMTEIEAKQRIAAQASPAERANVSDRILSSNQSLKLLLKDARLVWKEIELAAQNKASGNVG